MGWQGVSRKERKRIRQMDAVELADFVLEEKNGQERFSALQLIHSGTVLNRLARNDSDVSLRLDAISRIRAHDNQDALYAIAEDEEMPLSVRHAATRRLWSLSYLRRLIRYARTEEHVIETQAVRQLSSQAAIRQVAVESDNPAVRAAAVLRILEEEFLCRIAEDDSDFWVREAAVNCVSSHHRRAKLAAQLAYDRTIDNDTIRRLCADIRTNTFAACRACEEIWERTNVFMLPQNAYSSLCGALRDALHHPVNHVFLPEKVSFAGIDVNGNRCVAHMLADFYADERTPQEDRDAILACGGMIIAYVEWETRTGVRLERVLFDPCRQGGARVAV